MDKSWNSNPILTYLTLKEGVDVETFGRKIAGFIKTKNKDSNEELFLVPFSSRYLFNIYENGKQAGGRIHYVILFSMIALFFLVIACINFMNLSTARASRRLKEVGIKKAIGALRKTLIFQHLGESMLLTLISLGAAFLLVALILPQFSLITGKQLALTFDKNVILGALAITLITGLISGSYPAFYLSGFRPSEVLKGKLTTSLSELVARKALVVFQFSVSILLIVAVAIIYRQMNFVQTKNLGYKKDNIITFRKEGKLTESLDEFLLEAKNTSGVVNAACTDGLVINFNSTSSGHRWEEMSDDQEAFVFNSSQVGYDFFETLGLEITEGRTFSRDFSGENSRVIVNEAAVKAMNLEDPVGKWLLVWGRKLEIIGVVRDFHFKSLYEDIKPLMLFCDPQHTSTVIVKIQSGTETETIKRLEKLYQRFNPGLQFDFEFLDAEYQALYISEQRVAGLSKYFATIAIVISCLGLFGLAAFTAERRVKEIGIRKILGASEFGIIGMLSGDFTKMVLIAIGITTGCKILRTGSTPNGHSLPVQGQ
jgi:putative ABC transport system permease protein